MDGDKKIKLYNIRIIIGFLLVFYEKTSINGTIRVPLSFFVSSVFLSFYKVPLSEEH